jgi:hypothetical protein
MQSSSTIAASRFNETAATNVPAEPRTHFPKSDTGWPLPPVLAKVYEHLFVLCFSDLDLAFPKSLVQKEGMESIVAEEIARISLLSSWLSDWAGPSGCSLAVVDKRLSRLPISASSTA